MLEREQDVVEHQLKEYLQKIGDCVVVVADDDIVKVHVHTNDPGTCHSESTYLRLAHKHEDRYTR